ncbi:MAG: hypothetical protein AAF829_08780 [Pseudomonadota bacterium]
MDSATVDALDWSFDYLARTLCGLVAALGFDRFVPDLIMRPAWRRALRDVRLLEAIARRLLLALSGDLDITAKTVNPPCAPTAPMPGTARSNRVTKPGFCIVEPLPAIFGTGVPNACAVDAIPAAPLACTHRLALRIGALQAVLEDPQRVARRMALRRRHGRAGPYHMLGPLPSHGRTRSTDLIQSTLRHAHDLALAELNRGCPWPEIPSARPG